MNLNHFLNIHILNKPTWFQSVKHKTWFQPLTLKYNKLYLIDDSINFIRNDFKHITLKERNQASGKENISNDEEFII